MLRLASLPLSLVLKRSKGLDLQTCLILDFWMIRFYNQVAKSMMGLIGIGNNPMVGATVACAVAVEESAK